MTTFKKEIAFIRSLFPGQETIPLHEPKLGGREKELVAECIDSSYVSSLGEFVNQFESRISSYTGARYGVATVNGTCALHAALMAVGVGTEDEVLTQPLTFIATINAIAYCHASPVFIDVDRSTMGISPKALEDFLHRFAIKQGGTTVNRKTGRKIKACLPVHILGHPCRIDDIVQICDAYGIPVIEDSAEALGSLYRGKHAGCHGTLGIFSFNGNKIITAGGGGAVVTNDKQLAERIKHMTTTARVGHPFKFIHDMVGFNYRMPNLNAALLCGQMERLDDFVENKRDLARTYADFFSRHPMSFVMEPDHSRSNYWLNSVICQSRETRDAFLGELSENKIMARPLWELINGFDMYAGCQNDGLENARYLADRVVCLPSSVRL